MKAIEELKKMRQHAEEIESIMSLEIKNSKDWSRITRGIAKIDDIISDMLYEINELSETDSIDIAEENEYQEQEYRRSVL